MERLEPWMHVLCWGLPCATALALLLAGQLGPADAPRRGWCWIGSVANASWLGSSGMGGDGGSATGGAVRWEQLSFFYLPLTIIFLLNLAAYVRVGRAFSRMARDGAVDAAKEQQIQVGLSIQTLERLI